MSKFKVGQLVYVFESTKNDYENYMSIPHGVYNRCPAIVNAVNAFDVALQLINGSDDVLIKVYDVDSNFIHTSKESYIETWEEHIVKAKEFNRREQQKAEEALKLSQKMAMKNNKNDSSQKSSWWSCCGR
ncbi:MAG: hypothetical protein OEY10_00070 [Nitrosopumilus sp.]|nr:hypothetical protein [Nitrosopumilus sp.]